MKFLGLIPILLVVANLAHAEPSSPFRGPIVKKTSKRDRISSVAMHARNETTRIAPITFTARIRTEGTVVVSLTSKKDKHWDSTVVRGGQAQRDESSIELYQGTARIRRSFPRPLRCTQRRSCSPFLGAKRAQRENSECTLSLFRNTCQAGEWPGYPPFLSRYFTTKRVQMLVLVMQEAMRICRPSKR